jgi:hypothetical protein
MPIAPPIRRRWWLLLGGLLGVITGSLAPVTGGCVYHDTCIKVTSPGRDWCRNVALAKMWPVGGSFEDAEPILRPDGASPRGCRCYNDAEDQIFYDEAPECQYQGFVDDLEQAAREECQALVPPGYDHNCWTTSGSQASVVEDEFDNDVGSCVGNCEYGSPPVGGSCPNPSPYECATGGFGDEGCGSEGGSESSTGDSGLDDTSGNTSGGVLGDIESFVDCQGQDCEIDEAFARRLYADPSPLLDQGTRLVYDSKLRRHVLSNVEPMSLAHALGLRTGDTLESVDEMIIHDLDSALQVYVQLGDATAVDVRVKRGTRWLDFTYTFVP